MSTDYIRELRKIGHDLSNLEVHKMDKTKLTQRICFISATPRRLLDSSAYADALKAAKMFSRADFSVYFLACPEYPKFYEWFIFFLANVSEHFGFVITGFPVVPPDGLPKEAVAFMMKNREIKPKRVFKLINSFKNPLSRITILINGCPSVETWSYGDPLQQSAPFSLTGTTTTRPSMRTFNKSLPDNLVLMSICARLDVKDIKDRVQGNVSRFFWLLNKKYKGNPLLSADELFKELAEELRPFGEEAVIYSTTEQTASEKPFLL